MMSHIAMVGEASINLENLNLITLAQEPKFSGKESLEDHHFQEVAPGLKFSVKTILWSGDQFCNESK